MRWLIGVLAMVLLVTLLAPYASIPIYWMLGTHTFHMGRPEGGMDAVIIGRDAPQPDWMVTEPGAVWLTASRWTQQTRHKDAGSVEVLTHTDEAGLKALYAARLKAAGFTIEDQGLGPLHPAAAKLLLIGPVLVAKDPARRLEMTVLIREPSGLLGLGPRIVQIEWREFWPGQERGQPQP